MRHCYRFHRHSPIIHANKTFTIINNIDKQVLILFASTIYDRLNEDPLPDRFAFIAPGHELNVTFTRRTEDSTYHFVVYLPFPSTSRVQCQVTRPVIYIADAIRGIC